MCFRFPASWISNNKNQEATTGVVPRFLIKKKPAVTPRNHVAVYVGEVEKKRHVIPISYLSHPLFQDLLSHVEEEYGFVHPMGGLTIPCKEEAFLHIASQVHKSLYKNK